MKTPRQFDGARTREIMREKGIRITAAAEAIGITREHLGATLRGRWDPKTSTVGKLAVLLGVDFVDLLTPDFAEERRNRGESAPETAESASEDLAA